MAMFQQSNQENYHRIERIERLGDPVKERFLTAAFRTYNFLSELCSDIIDNFEKTISKGETSTAIRMEMNDQEIRTFIERLDLFYDCIKTSISSSTAFECQKFMIFKDRIANVIDHFSEEDLYNNKQKKSSKKSSNKNYDEKTIAEIDIDSKIRLMHNLSREIKIFLGGN